MNLDLYCTSFMAHASTITISRIPRRSKFDEMRRKVLTLEGGACGVMLKATVNRLRDRGCHHYFQPTKILLSRGINKSTHQSIAIERRPLHPLVPPPARLPDTKCHSSPHHSHFWSSFLALPSPRLFLRIVNRRGHGYAYCHFHSAFFGHHLT